MPFYEWFFKLAEVINKYLLQMWNDGLVSIPTPDICWSREILFNSADFRLIYGFCSKDEAEHLLKECRHPTLLIRFSDIEFTKIKISVRDSGGGKTVRTNILDLKLFQ